MKMKLHPTKEKIMSNVIPITGAREAPKAAQSRMDTQILTPEMVNEWRIPPFQRPLRVNEKVRAVSEQIKQSECIEGVITLGRLSRDPTIYVVDGQHRLEAFKLSLLAEVIADVRVVTFDSMAEMAEEFSRLNSSLVKMRPDDILRGLELSTPALALIRKHCEFVGYDHLRRSGSSPIVSMSALVRCWTASLYETPSAANSGMSSAGMAQNMDPRSVENLIAFLNIALAAWGRDPEYHRLWGNLNLTLCMWLWNKLVLDRERIGKRYIVLNAQEFKRCLMSVSADSDYLAWLPGRQMGDRDRSPCWARLKATFVRRITADSKTKPVLPQPAWASR